MSAFQMIPQSWYSWRFDVLCEGLPVAKMRVASFRQKGTITVGETPFEVHRERLENRRRGFVMQSADGKTIAQAYKPGFWSCSMRLKCEERSGRWLLKRPSFWRRRILVIDGEREAGAISPAGAMTRRADATLPDAMLMPVRVFVLWLAAAMWKRDAEATTATVAATSGG